MAGVLDRTRAMLERFRFDIRGEAHWVEPGNWITRAIIAGAYEPKSPVPPIDEAPVAPTVRPVSDKGAIARAG
jgi:hypothetical protein